MAEGASRLRPQTRAGMGLDGRLAALPISILWLGVLLSLAGIAVFVVSELLLGRR